MGRALVALGLLLCLLPGGARSLAADARTAVETFVAALADVQVADLDIRQSITLYHPDGRHTKSTGEQRVLMKLPRQQRLEQTIEGRREVRLAVGDRVWVRRPDGQTYEVPADDQGRDRTHLIVPFRRTAADLLAEWRSLGVRDDVTHVTRVAGRPTTVIGARPGERDSPAVWIDEEYGVVRFITRERLPTGPALLDLTFSEHRRLSGAGSGVFHFPFRQEAFVDGKLLVLVAVRSVTVNANLADALFDPAALRRER